MPPFRRLNRRTTRSLHRYATRMLGGVPRPRQPDYIAMTCRAIQQLLKIDQSLRPFMQEQRRLLEEYAWRQQVEAALHKVYGAKT